MIIVSRCTEDDAQINISASGKSSIEWRLHCAALSTLSFASYVVRYTHSTQYVVYVYLRVVVQQIVCKIWKKRDFGKYGDS